ncbi:MAG: transaldolase [Armatimonadota bacterium]
MTKLHELHEAGQSVWLDTISRALLNSGELQRLIDLGVRGATSNPTILDKAVSGSSDYDEDIRRLAAEGKTSLEIYEHLALDDIGRAADLFRPLYDATEGRDGFMSLEVSPLLAYDTDETIAQVRQLVGALGRQNVFIKIPATPQGIPAIAAMISEGVNVNVTLIFGLEQYRAVIEAYQEGLERRLEGGGDISRIASVASFFVSRVDTAVDKQLQEKGDTELLGKIAIANAKVAYEFFLETFQGPRWERLAASGARVQRPLWASTATKNPAYSDTLYVDELIGPDTVNTMPLETMQAFMDHGHLHLSLLAYVEEAHRQLAQLADLGIILGDITDRLTEDGVALFSKSFNNLLSSIAGKGGHGAHRAA